MRINSEIIDLSRDLMAAIRPVTGVSGTGKILIKSRSSSPVYLPANWHLYPIVNGADREDLTFRISEGPGKARYPNGVRQKSSEDEPDINSWWVIQPGGTLVDIHSLVGGQRHNLPAGTKFIIDPQNPLVDSEVTLQTNITNGSDPTHFGGCKSVVLFNQIAGNNISLNAFRSCANSFPAVIITWVESLPADGSTQSTLDRGKSSLGSDQLLAERFDIFILSSRLDSEHKRRNEGLKLMEDITKWLANRKSADGQIFSSPAGVHITARGGIVENAANYQHVYDYFIRLSVTNTLVAYDERNYNDWVSTHLIAQTHDKDQLDQRLTVVSKEFDMNHT